jgi:predicted dehydrogenase
VRYYSWARFFDYDTGLFGQLFSHEFDAVNQLLNLGIPNTVSSTGGQYFYKEIGDMPDVLHTSFEYADKGTTLTYSANLTSSKNRPRTIYGRDASMTVGGDLTVTPDVKSEQYAGLLGKGLVDSSRPMLEILEGSDISDPIDAVTSASIKYYASRGLTTTTIDGQQWDVTQLHLKEWLDCIRDGGETSANIEKAFQEAVVIAMADISYREGHRHGRHFLQRKMSYGLGSGESANHQVVTGHRSLSGLRYESRSAIALAARQRRVSRGRDSSSRTGPPPGCRAALQGRLPPARL